MSTLSETSIQEAFKSEDKFTKLVTDIASDLTNSKYDVSKFVESIGFLLTSTVVEERVNGTRLLSCILERLPKDFLNDKQLTFLATFYVDRLKDQHNVIPNVINGIAVLIKMKHFPRDCVSQFLQTFFLNSTCQSQVRDDRAKLFNIFKYLIENYPEELKILSGDFLFGLINSIDGERDPRNLDLIFTFMPNFLANFPLLHLRDEMFEIFACYFPIDFHPTKTDPETITRERLAEKLAKCLVGTPEFIEWAIDLALEKLETDLIIAKLDSLELLEEAALKHPPKALEQYFPQIWSGIKTEIFPGSDNTDVTAAGLKALRTILEQASSAPEISHNHQTLVMGTILTHLSDIQQRLFNPATSIALVCVSGDAAFASEKILNTFLIKLEAKNDTEENAAVALNDEQRIKLYNIIAQIYKISTMRNALMQVNTDISARVHSLVIATLRSNEDSSDKPNIELIRAALSVINESVPIISEVNRALIYKVLVHLVTHPTIDLDLNSLLSEMGALYPIELQANFIDVCVRNFSIFSNTIKRKIYKNLLPLVPQLAFTERVLDLVQTNVWSANTPSDVRLLALDAFNSLLKQQDAQFIVSLQLSQSLVDKLIKLAQTTDLDFEALEYIAATLSLIVQHLAITEQYMIATEYLPKLNLQIAADLFIAKGLLGFLHKNISLDDHFERLLDDLTQLSLSSEHEELRLVAHHLLCSLVNKIEYNDANRSVLAKIIAKLKSAIRLGDAKAVEILSWIGKGITMRGSDEVGEIIEALADLLDHPSLSSAATLAFDILSAEYPQLHLPMVKFLYKQKFFNMVMSKLSKKLEAYCEHHLNAFIYVLKATPHAVLKINIVKVLPILFKSLETTRENTLCIALGICENFIKSEDEYFLGSLDELVPKCLKLTQFKQSMQVRITSLNLLHDMTKYPISALMPHKIEVILALSPVLDDPKRMVRNAAVNARNAWYLVGTPGVFDGF